MTTAIKASSFLVMTAIVVAAVLWLVHVGNMSQALPDCDLFNSIPC